MATTRPHRLEGSTRAPLFAGLAVGGAGFVAVLVGVIAGFATDDTRHAVVGLLVALGLGAVAAAAAGFVVWRMLRRPHYSTLFGYSWKRRSRVGKALRRGEDVADDDMPIAEAIADLTRRQRRIAYLYPVPVAVWVIAGVAHHGAARWLFFVAAGFFLVAIPCAVRQRRRVLANYDRLAGARPATLREKAP